MGTRIASRFCLVLSLALAGCAIAPDGPPAVALFNGRDFTGWQAPHGAWQVVGGVKLDGANPKTFLTTAGSGVMLNSATNRTVNLISEAEFGDCEAHIEFCVPRNSNSGIYFLGRYEVQVFDSWGVKTPQYSDCGGIYKSCSDPKPDSTGRPPAANASRPPGEWQSFDVVFRAPRFDANGRKTENARFIKVVHNGRVIHENVESERPTCAARWLDEKPRGPIMLQGDHGPVAYRVVSVRPVELK